MRSLLWNQCSWQLSVETLQKDLWYPWNGQNAVNLVCGTAQGDGKQGRSGIETLELQVCCGAELSGIFMLLQCVCRCVGDG